MTCPHNSISGDNYGRVCNDCGKTWDDTEEWDESE